MIIKLRDLVRSEIKKAVREQKSSTRKLNESSLSNDQISELQAALLDNIMTMRTGKIDMPQKVYMAMYKVIESPGSKRSYSLTRDEMGEMFFPLTECHVKVESRVVPTGIIVTVGYDYNMRERRPFRGELGSGGSNGWTFSTQAFYMDDGTIYTDFD